MKRITLITLILFISAFIYSESIKIVILETMPVPVVLSHSDAVKSSLENLSEKESMDIEIEVLKGRGDKERCKNMLRSSISRKKPDAVISIATLATQAALEVLDDTDIPILFCVVMDPVGSGIVDEVGVPSRNNISGVVYTHQRDTKIEMMMRVLGESYREKGVKVGIVSSDYPSAVGDIRELETIAANYSNLTYVKNQVPYRAIPDELPRLLEDFQIAINEIKDDVDFLWEVGGPLGEVQEASQIILESGKPLVLANTPRSVKMGGLMSIATDYEDVGLQIVEMLHLILDGVDVGTLPVATPRKFDLYLNLKTAEELNISIPSHLLMIAGEHIYYE